MHRRELYEMLVGLARDVGIEVRALPRGTPGPADELPARGGICRLRGCWWVLLSPADTLEDRIELVARAVRTHGGGRLEERYLPPALRACLEDVPEAPDGDA